MGKKQRSFLAGLASGIDQTLTREEEARVTSEAAREDFLRKLMLTEGSNVQSLLKSVSEGGSDPDTAMGTIDALRGVGLGAAPEVKTSFLDRLLTATIGPEVGKKADIGFGATEKYRPLLEAAAAGGLKKRAAEQEAEDSRKLEFEDKKQEIVGRHKESFEKMKQAAIAERQKAIEAMKQARTGKDGENKRETADQTNFAFYTETFQRVFGMKKDVAEQEAFKLVSGKGDPVAGVSDEQLFRVASQFASVDTPEDVAALKSKLTMLRKTFGKQSTLPEVQPVVENLNRIIAARRAKGEPLDAVKQKVTESETFKSSGISIDDLDWGP